jgi:hypothetical protein
MQSSVDSSTPPPVRSATVESSNGSPDHNTTPAIFPGSSEPVRSSTPSAHAAFRVIQRSASCAWRGGPIQP